MDVACACAYGTCIRCANLILNNLITELEIVSIYASYHYNFVVHAIVNN
jgi:hypothetical protein